MPRTLGAGFVARFAAVLLSFLTAGVPDAGAAEAGPVLPASLAGHPDQGTYRFYLNEEVLITSTFSLAPSGAYTSSYTINMGGQTLTIPMQLEVDSGGYWNSIEMDSPQGKIRATRVDSTVTIALPKETITVVLKPNVVFHDASPMNADAVKFTFDRYKETGVASPIYAGINQIAAVEVVDDLTVRFVFDAPAANFWSTVSMPYAAVVSPASVEAAAGGGGTYGPSPSR